MDKNRSDNPRDNFQGLQLRCNEFKSCNWDIAVLHGTSPPSGLLGVAYLQGQPADGPVGTEDLAGNLFTSSSYPYLVYNYEVSSQCRYVSYQMHYNYYQYPRLKPTFYNNNKFGIEYMYKTYNPDLSCPSHINSNSSKSSEKELLLNVQKSNDNYDNLKKVTTTDQVEIVLQVSESNSIESMDGMNNQFSAKKYERNYAIKDGTGYVLSNEELSKEEKLDLLLTFNKDSDNPHHQMRVAAVYDEMGEIGKAESIYTNLLMDHYDTPFHKRLSDYLELKDLVNTWSHEPISREAQIGYLEAYTNATSMAASFARTVSTLDAELPKAEEIVIPEAEKQNQFNDLKGSKLDNITANSSLSVYPNPVYDKLNVNYSIEKDFSSLVLSIIDVFGITVQSRELKDAKGEILILTDDLPSGNYIVQLWLMAEFKKLKK